MQTAHCIKKIPFFVNDLFSSMISPEIVKKSELGFYTGKFSSNTAFSVLVFRQKVISP